MYNVNNGLDRYSNAAITAKMASEGSALPEEFALLLLDDPYHEDMCEDMWADLEASCELYNWPIPPRLPPRQDSARSGNQDSGDREILSPLPSAGSVPGGGLSSLPETQVLEGNFEVGLSVELAAPRPTEPLLTTGLQWFTDTSTFRLADASHSGAPAQFLRRPALGGLPRIPLESEVLELGPFEGWAFHDDKASRLLSLSRDIRTAWWILASWLRTRDELLTDFRSLSTACMTTGLTRSRVLWLRWDKPDIHSGPAATVTVVPELPHPKRTKTGPFDVWSLIVKSPSPSGRRSGVMGWALVASCVPLCTLGLSTSEIQALEAKVGVQHAQASAGFGIEVNDIPGLV